MSLEPGSHLSIQRHVFIHSRNLDIGDLVKLPLETLKEKETDSVAKEKALHSKIEDLELDWEEQAKMTIRLRSAQEYLRVPAIEHTFNQWMKREYDWYELSNMVYKMTYRISEGTLWRSNQRPPPTCWDLAWSLVFNTPKNPDHTGSGRKIAGQDKRFVEKADMEKYLQGRIKAYAHLFMEISPPIPEEHQKRFFVNGVLLPGYTVDSPEQYAPDEGTVENLLAFIDGSDLSHDSQDALPAQPAETPPEEIWSRHRRQRQDTLKKNQTPTR